jgi:hypothetical protein
MLLQRSQAWCDRGWPACASYATRLTLAWIPHSTPIVAPAGDRASAAGELAAAIKAAGVSSLTSSGALAKLQAGLEAKDAAEREGTLLAIAAIATGVGRPAEPYLIPLLAPVLAALADKATPVRVAAASAQAALEGLLCPHGIAAVLPTLFDAMLAQKWQTNEGACKMLSALADRAPRQVAVCLPDIVPKVTEAMGNARPAVKDAAVEAMTKCMNVVGNRDIDQFIPILVNCLQAPANVPDTIHKLAATTFVQTVEAPTLSIMVGGPVRVCVCGVGCSLEHAGLAGLQPGLAGPAPAASAFRGAQDPRPLQLCNALAVSPAPNVASCSLYAIQVPLLVRGLRQDNTTAIKRKTAVIIENMAKLVDK